MRADPDSPLPGRIDELYRSQSRRVLATLIRLLGDFDLAEEALHDAFTAALEQWPRVGMPRNPTAWLVSAGRFKAIDRLRRRARFNAALGELAARLDARTTDATHSGSQAIHDDALRLIFTCCHPALSPDAQVAMTLREVCGLRTEEVARGVLASAPTVAQRIVRAKATIAAARIPYEVPSPEELPDRLEIVLRVVYLVFTEGYAAGAGDSLVRPDLADEGIRLGRLIVDLVAPDSEAFGLLALMLLQDARRGARTSSSGDLVLLADQDRNLWDAGRIAEGMSLLERSASAGPPGPFALQAAIAAVHGGAQTAAATDWDRIVALYDLLARAEPSPVVELNRAVAVAMRDGPAVGLPLIEALLERGDLRGYGLAHAAHADLMRRLGRSEEARAAYEHAHDHVRTEPERRFIRGRLRDLADGPAARPPATKSASDDARR